MRDFGSSISGCEHSSHLDGEGLGRRAVDFLRKELTEIVIRDLYNDPKCNTSWRYEQSDKILAVLDVYWPNIDPEQPDCLVIWPSPDARTKGRKARTAMRIGRTLRRMFPVLTDVEIEALADKVKREFASKTYTLHKSKEAASFAHAYSYQQSAYGNLTTTTYRKHSANSCMRYDFDSQPNHPTEAYASGDFEMVWLEDEEGKIAARCVVAVAMAGSKLDTPIPSAVYAVSEPAMDKFLELTGIDPEHNYSRDWIGCRLKALPHNDGYQAPYLDLNPRYLDVSSCGEYLEITRNGSLDANAYGGILYDYESYTCCSCGDRVPEGDTLYVQDEVYCYDCYNEQFVECDHCHEPTPRDESYEVRVGTSWGGRPMLETWCQHCVDHDAVETIDGVLWHCDEVVYLANGDAVDQETADRDYFQDEIDGEYYPNDMAQNLEFGGQATMENILEFNSRGGHHRYNYDCTQEVWVLEEVSKGEQEVA